MKIKSPSYHLTASLTVAAIATALAAGTAARAMTSATASTRPDTASVSLAAGPGRNAFEAVAFSDGAEARRLRDAYRILATGDHDYRGHRVKAMHQIEAAGKLLGMDIAGDLKDRTPQPLSDDILRNAQDLIRTVRNSAEVKDQERVTRHLDNAIAELDAALATR
jgi:hypothetical protein